jgi:ABC-type antimicrobial peptide transport system permease subunit
MALGAGRGRLAQLFVTESLLIATLGGATSLMVAAVIATMVRKSLLTNIEWTSSPVSGRVLLMSFVVTLGVGVLVAIAPVVQAARGSCECNAPRQGAPVRALEPCCRPR